MPAGAEGDDRASRALQGVNYKQFAPRAGVAYSLPGDKTVVRGGFGIFYSNLITLGGMQSMEINPPNHVRINQTTQRAVPQHLPQPGIRRRCADSPAFARNVTLVSYDRSRQDTDRLPVERQRAARAAGQVVVDVGYNSNHFVNDWRQIDGNPAPPGPGDINARRQFTSAVVPGTSDVITLSNVVRIQKDGWSRYRALQTKVEKRYSKGVSLLASYAWSRTIGLGNNFQDAQRHRRRGGRGRHGPDPLLRRSGVWELPVGRDGDRPHLERAALGGWSVSPIVTLASGAPLNLTVNGNPANTGQKRPPERCRRLGAGRPDAQSSGSTPPRSWPTTVTPSATRLGTCCAAPRTFNVDMVVRKTVPVSGAGQRRPAIRIIQRDQHAGVRQPQHAGGQRQLRPHLVGRRRAQQPGRASSCCSSSLVVGRWWFKATYCSQLTRYSP